MTRQELEALNPCDSGMEYARKFPTLQAAWDACERGDWMLWLLKKRAGEINSPAHRKFTLCKAACARLVLHIFESKYPADKRPRAAIEVAERYGSGGEDYAAAAYADDAAAAAPVAYAAYAAAYAAYAAAYAADATDAAADAAAYAAYAAAYAADADAAADAAADADAAARKDMLKRCADAIRTICPTI